MEQSYRNATHRMLKARLLWPNAMLTLEETSRKGGRRVIVQGDGRVIVQRLQPGWQETRYLYWIDAAEFEALMELCIDHDLKTVDPPLMHGPEHEGPVQRLRLSPAGGISGPASVWRNQNVPDNRFEAIYQAMRAFETRSENMTPIYTGEYAFGYTPRWRWQSRLRNRARQAMYDLYQFNPRYFFEDLSSTALNILEIAMQLWLVWPVVIILFLVAYFAVDINPERHYGFPSGLLHGGFWYQNAILILFTSRTYAFAPLNSGWLYKLGCLIGMVILPAAVGPLINLGYWVVYRRR